MSGSKIQNYIQQLNIGNDVLMGEVNASSQEFESFYLGLRKSEKRLLSDEEVANLPILKNSQHTKEWEKRAGSAKRLTTYFSNIKSGNILDLGCGNGWFTALLAQNKNLEVVGMDVNLDELKQAARIFQKTNLNFLYGDVFQIQFPEKSFDYITVNAVIQYFEDLCLLINRLLDLLKPGGEIHFIDSPFYKQDELTAAKSRTVEYYNGMGFPEMSKYYFHHSWNEISIFDPVVLYEYKSKGKILRLFKNPDMPFPWIKIINKDG